LRPFSEKSILIFGCGNIMFGDDGFGPAVINYLKENYALPEEALAMDVGTSIRDLLFDILLDEHKPRKIIIVDAVDHPGRQPGEVFEIGVDDISPQKTADFSLHQFPTVNMLKELKDYTRVDIHILVAQVMEIPEEVRPGLSAQVTEAIPEVCQRILKNL
jgi:coenzyme F420 hydrogenase subunit delta